MEREVRSALLSFSDILRRNYFSSALAGQLGKYICKFIITKKRKIMKKISKTTWNRYKESAEGKEVMALFERIISPESSAEEILEIAKRFDPQFFNNSSKKDMARLAENLDFFLNALGDILSDKNIKFESGEDYVNFYYNFLKS